LESGCGRLLPRTPGVTVTDVTAAPTEASLLAAVLESSSDAILFIDRAGMIIGSNDAAEKMVGLRKKVP
jgi:PAS domain-containing protein